MLLRKRDGLSWRGISKFLNDNNIKSVKGKKFSPQLVERIIFKYKRRLKNMKYYKKDIINVRVEEE